MPRYEIRPITDRDGNEIFSVVDVLDLSGNNEIAAFWTPHEAAKFVTLSNEWQDIDPYGAVSLREEDDPYIPHKVRLVAGVFCIQEKLSARVVKLSG